eukprot:c28232_g1_i2 orf=361-2001(-)
MFVTASPTMHVAAGNLCCSSIAAVSFCSNSRQKKVELNKLWLDGKRVVLRCHGEEKNGFIGNSDFQYGLKYRAEQANNGTTATSHGNSVPISVPSEQTICRLFHVQDHVQDLRTYVSPLVHSRFFHPNVNFWLTETDMVAQNIVVDINDPSPSQTYFHRAGPRYQVIFAPGEVRAAIVTCGGLCPGMNTVIREIVYGLWHQYDVKDIKGIKSGYRGFYTEKPMPLCPELVDNWHKQGGTCLGTSRGGFDLDKIMDAIEKQRLNQIYIIGGDGTIRGAVKVFEEVRRRGMKVIVVGIPKTVDNDVGIIDRSFGFQTAVDAAQAAIGAAHTEAESTPNGVGVVKLMGRYAGHIAVHATLSSRNVDCCLIPEVPFFMDGPGGLLEFVNQRLKEHGHCVIVVAEGAGQDLIERTELVKDASGNLLLGDIGVWLTNKLKQWWKRTHEAGAFSCKYIDPTYMIRAVPSNATDTSYCTLLAHSAIHGAMAGYTGFVAGPVNGNFCYIPMGVVADTQHLVDVNSHTWAWVKSVNNQPDFIREDVDKYAIKAGVP